MVSKIFFSNMTFSTFGIVLAAVSHKPLLADLNVSVSKSCLLHLDFLRRLFSHLRSCVDSNENSVKLGQKANKGLCVFPTPLSH
jgi:hypothetical protein